MKIKVVPGLFISGLRVIGFNSQEKYIKDPAAHAFIVKNFDFRKRFFFLVLLTYKYEFLFIRVVGMFLSGNHG